MSLSINTIKYKMLAVALSVALVVCAVLHPVQARAASTDIPVVSFETDAPAPSVVKAELDALVLPSLTLVLGIIGFIALTYCVCRNVDIGIDYSGQTFFEKCQTVGQYMYEQLSKAAQGATDQAKESLSKVFYSVSKSVQRYGGGLTPTPSGEPEPSGEPDTPRFGVWGRNMGKFQLIQLGEFWGALSLYFDSSFNGVDTTPEAEELLEIVQSPAPVPVGNPGTFSYLENTSSYTYKNELIDYISQSDVAYHSDGLPYVNTVSVGGGSWRLTYHNYILAGLYLNDEQVPYTYVVPIFVYNTSLNAYNLYYYLTTEGSNRLTSLSPRYSDYNTISAGTTKYGFIFGNQPSGSNSVNIAPNSTYYRNVHYYPAASGSMPARFNTTGIYDGAQWVRYLLGLGVRAIGIISDAIPTTTDDSRITYYNPPVNDGYVMTVNRDYVTRPKSDEATIDIANTQTVLDPEAEKSAEQEQQRQRIEDQLNQGSTQGMQEALLGLDPNAETELSPAVQDVGPSGPTPDPTAPNGGLIIPGLDNIWKYVRYTFNTLGGFISYCGQCLEAVTVGEGGLSWFFYGAFIMFVCGGFISKLLL